MRTTLVAFLIAVLFTLGCIVFAITSGQEPHGETPATLRYP
jgi:hypothetical protein